jgi:hypothetical protein
MNTRIRNQHDSAVNPDAHRSQAMSSDQAIHWWNRPAAVRIGGIAGMLSTLPLLAASMVTATAGQNLRQNGFPWAAVLAAILTALCVLGVTALHSSRWAAPVRATGLVTSAALLGIAGFFMALGFEDLLATWAGVARFLSDNEVITGIGTLTGSVLTLVLAPLGLLVVGIATFRSRLLSSSGRLSAVALGPCLILGALISAAAMSAPVAAAWVPIFCICWFMLGRSLLRSAS